MSLGFVTSTSSGQRADKDIKETFVDQIVAMHEVHVWCLVPNKIYATLHVVFKDEECYFNSLVLLNTFLLNYGINQATIQPEFARSELTDVQNVSSPLNVRKGIADEDDIQECPENNVPINSTPMTELRQQSCCLLPCPKENCMKKRCCTTGHE